MANIRLTQYENFPAKARCATALGLQLYASRLFIQGIELGGSVSLNSLAMLCAEIQATVLQTMDVTVKVGIYTLNASTLTLVNSASMTTNTLVGKTDYQTFVLSATSDLSPGNYYLAFNYSSVNSLGTAVTLFDILGGNTNAMVALANGRHGGLAVRGVLNSTTDGIPASINTSAISKDGGAGNSSRSFFPYILISA